MIMSSTGSFFIEYSGSFAIVFQLPIRLHYDLESGVIVNASPQWLNGIFHATIKKNGEQFSFSVHASNMEWR